MSLERTVVNGVIVETWSSVAPPSPAEVRNGESNEIEKK
jgi:hypothetical protein